METNLHAERQADARESSPVASSVWFALRITMKPYYQDSAVTIYHGDTLEVMVELPENCAQAVITDPPYSSGTRREGAKGLRKSMNRETKDEAWFGTDSLTTTGFLWLMRSCALQWRRVLPGGAHILSFIDWRMMPHLQAAVESADVRIANLLVWDKTFFGMGACFRNQHELILHWTKGVGSAPMRRDTANVLSVPAVRNGEHETEKPLELLTRLVSVVVPESATVLDCFCGSGVTLAAAKLQGRKAIGVDNEERNCEMAARKCSQEVLSLSSANSADKPTPAGA
jgi:site-specific DNA-methyltransferase (adenine-specific)